MSLTQRFFTNNGQSLPSIAPGFTMYGIVINNATGSWLFVRPLNNYVPPYTLGWSRDLRGVISLDVLFSDSPSGAGSPDTAGTGNVTVEVSEASVGNSEGFPSGSGAKVPVTAPLAFVYGSGKASQTGSVTNLSLVGPLNPQYRMVIRRLAATPDFTTGLPAGTVGFDHPITLQWISHPIVGIDIISWQSAISPEHPYAEAVFEDGALVFGGGRGLSVGGIVESGGGSQFYIAEAQYYLTQTPALQT